MSLVNKVLGKDKKNKKEEEKKTSKKVKKVEKKKKDDKKEKKSKSKKTKNKTIKKNISNQGIAYKVLIAPVITEKATMLQSQGIYSFYVNPSANKIEIKKAIQEVFDVKPKSVKTIKLPGKTIRRGLTVGRTKNRKKALIYLEKGDNIELVGKK